MDQYEMIRTAHRAYETSISEISRITGHSRNTIKRAIRGEPWGYKERAHQPFPVLEKYLPIIDGWLIGDKDSPKKQRHTARRIYNRLVDEHGYKGSEPTVRRYVRFAKLSLGFATPCAFVPCDPDGRTAGVTLPPTRCCRNSLHIQSSSNSFNFLYIHRISSRYSPIVPVSSVGMFYRFISRILKAKTHKPVNRHAIMTHLLA